MSPASITRTKSRVALLTTLPILFLVIAAMLANAGVPLTPKAKAAALDTVTVTATVGSALNATDGCGGAINIAVTLGGVKDGTCAFTFGSTNDPTVSLRAYDTDAGTFFTSGFADESTACANMTTDESGLKVVSVGANVTNVWGCPTTAADTNTGLPYKGVPDAALGADVCLTNTTASAARTCTLAIGVFEAGSDLAPGAYATGATLGVDVLP